MPIKQMNRLESTAFTSTPSSAPRKRRLAQIVAGFAKRPVYRARQSVSGFGFGQTSRRQRQYCRWQSPHQPAAPRNPQRRFGKYRGLRHPNRLVQPFAGGCGGVQNRAGEEAKNKSSPARMKPNSGSRQPPSATQLENLFALTQTQVSVLSSGCGAVQLNPK